MSLPPDTPHEMNEHTPERVMTADPDPDHDDFAAYDDFGDDNGLPGRPRRVLLNRYTALLATVLVGAGCFYAGVRVEKSQVSASTATTGTGRFSALASRFGAAGSASGTGRTAGGSGGAGGGFGGAGGGSGFGARFGAGAGRGTAGTISTISGKNLYITESDGNTVKVTLSSTTTLTKSEKVSTKQIFPGDTVSVTGASAAGGTVNASAVSDSGASATSGSGTTGTAVGSGSTTGSGAGLSSLFGG